jgi:GNAT superfamily N-acetyltransferase
MPRARSATPPPRARSATTPLAFLAYHTRTGRTRFVDQLFVASAHRRRGLGTALLAQLATGPIELIARRDNVAAVALYAQLGLCVVTHDPPYAPEDDEVFFRTTNYKRTAALLRARPAPALTLARWARWDAVPEAARRFMVQAVWTSLPTEVRDAKVRALRNRRRLSEDEARERVALAILHPDDDVRYIAVTAAAA